MALVHTDINCSPELHVRRLWELESSELGRKEVPSIRAKVLKQIRVDGAAVKEKYKINSSFSNPPLQFISHSPIENDSLLLGLGIGDLHICDAQAIDRSRFLIQEDLHGKWRSWTHIQLSTHDLVALAYCNTQDGLRGLLNHHRGNVQISGWVICKC